MEVRDLFIIWFPIVTGTFIQCTAQKLLDCLFSIEGHVGLDRNLGPIYNTLLLQLIPGVS